MCTKRQDSVGCEHATGDGLGRPDQLRAFPDLLTETELIEYLRIPSITSAANLHNVIEHLKRFRGLPRIHICNKTLYPRKAIMDWIEAQTRNGD
jgi:hypothetical protein